MNSADKTPAGLVADAALDHALRILTEASAPFTDRFGATMDVRAVAHATVFALYNQGLLASALPVYEGGQVWIDNDNLVWQVCEADEDGPKFHRPLVRAYTPDELCAPGSGCAIDCYAPHLPLVRAQVVKNAS